jgi:hypothetical protein
MEINAEGHLLTSPREVCERLNEPARLINDVFIPGTPVAFPTYARFCDFLASCADAIGVHPRNLLVRGSTKLGFSISPDAASAWVEMRPDSDLDLAIIDPDYYHFLDREIRMWERRPENKAFRGIQFSISIARQKQRGFYTYRYFDLPEIGRVTEHTAQLKALPVEACCGLPRPIDAFIFRDWWSLYSRWEFDLRDLRRALGAGLESGGDIPRAFQNAGQ